MHLYFSFLVVLIKNITIIKITINSFVILYKNKKPRGLPGIEPGTASTLKKNHTTRPKPLVATFNK